MFMPSLDLWKKVTIGLVVGIILGFIFKEDVVYIKPVGDIFIKLIKMILVPLVFFAIVGGISQVADTRTLGRVGMRAAFYYVMTTFFAICIGLGTAYIFKPGVGLDLKLNGGTLPPTETGSALTKVFNVLMNVVPDNAIAAMAEGTFLQVVFFALFTGLILNKMEPEKKKRLSSIFQLLADMVFKMVHVIVQFAPYGACALMAFVVGTQGMKVLQSLMRLILTAYAALGIQYVVFGVLIAWIARLSPFPFYRKSFEYQALAFSTSSTKAALPTTIRVAQERLGVSKTGSSFILPLGASINMDGLAIYLGVGALFFAQAFGRELGGYDYFMIILTATLGSIGGAGIPSAAIIMMPMVLSAIQLPVEGIALLAGIDRIIDMMRSTISITGDVAVTVMVDAQEGTLDRKVYNEA